jgi:putative phosphoesterase
MKILVLSDSHSSMRFMRQCVERVKPDAIVHLGDHYDDATALAEEYPHIRMHQVPGTFDRFRCPPGTHEILCYDVGGLRLYMTHGHRHNVKYDVSKLLSDARSMKAAAALYGHTHIPDCRQEPDGLWVLNPGTSGYGDGTAGLMETENGMITACRLLLPADLEEIE